MSETTSTLPISSALTEASPDSLAEVLNRDPEGYRRQDRDVVVAALRAQRARFEKAEAEGKPKAASKTLPAALKTLEAKKNAGELGL